MIPIQPRAQLKHFEPAAIICGCADVREADKTTYFRIPYHEWKEHLKPLAWWADDEFKASFYTQYPEHHKDPGNGSTWRTVDISNWTQWHFRMEALYCWASDNELCHQHLKTMQDMMFRYDSPDVVSYRMIATLMAEDLKAIIQDEVDRLYEVHGLKIIELLKKEFQTEAVE